MTENQKLRCFEVKSSLQIRNNIDLFLKLGMENVRRFTNVKSYFD